MADHDEELQKAWRNRAVSDTFEPGSIFKIITAIAALEEGVVDDNTTFSCGGSTVVGGRTIKCWRTSGHGGQNFSDIIKNSCNMGFIQLGQKLGKEKQKSQTHTQRKAIESSVARRKLINRTLSQKKKRIHQEIK